MSLRARLLFFGVVLLALISPGDLGSVDTSRRLQVAHSFWTDQPEVAAHDQADFGIRTKTRGVRAWYGIGQSLVLLPADVIVSTLLHQVSGDHGVDDRWIRARGALIGLLTFPLLGMLGLGCAWGVLRDLGLEARDNYRACLLLLFGTSFLVHTQISQEAGLLFVCSAGMLLFWLRWLREPDQIGWAAGSAAFLGFAVLTKLPSILDGLALLIATSIALRQRIANQGRSLIRGAATWLLVLAGFIAADRLYHAWRFGSALGSYIHLYGTQAKALDPSLPPEFPFSTAFVDGFVGAFASPRYALFLYEPLLMLLFLFPWVSKPRGSVRLAVIYGALALVMQAAAYATYYNWRGGDGWGNRFLAAHAQMLSLLLVAWLTQVGGWRALKSFPAVVATIAVTVQVAACVFWYQLEETQQRATAIDVGQLPLRLMNLIAIPLGRFKAWELHQPGVSERMLTPNFLPFLAWEDLGALGTFAIAAWLLLLGWTLWGLLKPLVESGDVNHEHRLRALEVRGTDR